MMTHKDTATFWEKANECRKSVARSLDYFEVSGIDVDGMVTDAAIKLLEEGREDLDIERLPGLLRWKAQKLCLDRLRRWDDDPERRVDLYGPSEPGVGCQVKRVHF
jgi:hypothetical protein